MQVHRHSRRCRLSGARRQIVCCHKAFLFCGRTLLLHDCNLCFILNAECGMNAFEINNTIKIIILNCVIVELGASLYYMLLLYARRRQTSSFL